MISYLFYRVWFFLLLQICFPVIKISAMTTMTSQASQQKFVVIYPSGKKEEKKLKHASNSKFLNNYIESNTYFDSLLKTYKDQDLQDTEDSTEITEEAQPIELDFKNKYFTNNFVLHVSDKSIASFLDIFKKLYVLENKPENILYLALYDQLMKIPFASRVVCSTLTEYLVVPALIAPCASALAETFIKSNYLQQFRSNKKFFDLISQIRAPDILRLAALYLIKYDQNNIYTRLLYLKQDIESREKNKSSDLNKNLNKQINNVILSSIRKHNIFNSTDFNILKLIGYNSNNRILAVLDDFGVLNLIYLSQRFTALKYIKLAHDYKVNSAVISTNQELIATGLTNGSVCLFDIINGEKICEFNETTKPIRALKIDETNSSLVALTNDEIFIWDLNTKIFITSFILKKEKFCPFVEFKRNCNNIILVTQSGKIYSITIDFKDSANYKLAREFGFVSCKLNRSIEKFVIVIKEQLGFQENISCCCLHPNKKMLAAVSLDKTVSIWDINEKKIISSFDISYNPKQIIFSSANTSGSYVAIIGQGKVPICLWDIYTGQPFAAIKNGNIKSILSCNQGDTLITTSIKKQSSKNKKKYNLVQKQDQKLKIIIDKFDISDLREFVFNNSYVFEHMLFLRNYLKACVKNKNTTVRIDLEKDHIKKLFSQFPIRIQQTISRKLNFNLNNIEDSLQD